MSLVLGVFATSSLAHASSFTDVDDDGRPNETDNCPCQPNADQADGDGDGIGDACDPAPSTSALTRVAASAREDSDGDGVADGHDNCPEKRNPSQADGDHDGVGDACDVCLCVADPRPADRPDPRQPDGDNDGIPDACDVCPEVPSSSQAVDPSGVGLQCSKAPARVSSWETFPLKDRDPKAFFLRPLFAIWWGQGVPRRGQSVAGLNAYVSGSIDRWKYRQGVVPGAVAHPVHGEPPSWYWRAGAFADLRFTDVATMGPLGGVDFRPLNSPAYMDNPVLGLLTLGAEAHLLWRHDFSTSATTKNQVQAGLGLKVAVLDAFSIVPFAQVDLANDAHVSAGALVLFDLAVLEQLGVKDRIPLARRYLWAD